VEKTDASEKRRKPLIYNELERSMR
jgi:hypothetical protein